MSDIGLLGIYNNWGLVGAAAFLFWAVFSVTLHELAHGWAAIWQGDQTPRIYGRMTWNPVVHMGWMSLILLALVGFCGGMMPTDPSQYRWGRRGRIVVSGAGPAMNIALALLCWTVVGVLVGKGIDRADEDALTTRLFEFALIGGMLNGVMALFNMLPLPPFDGASVVAGFSRTYYRWMHDPRVQNAGFFIVVIAMFSGFADLCSVWATRTGAAWAALVADLIGPGALG